MDPKIMAEIEKMVETMFSKKEDADKKEAVTAALEEAKGKLDKATDIITAKEDEIASLEEKLEKAEEALASYKEENKEVSELSDKLASITEELDALKASYAELEEAKKAVDKSIEEKEVELAATKEEFDKVSTELNEIKTEQLVASRMDELSSEGVAREGEGREVQVAKIKEMDDEAFAAYKAELVDIKKAVASKLGSSASTDQAGLNVETETGEGSANTEELGAAFCEAFGIGSVSK